MKPRACYGFQDVSEHHIGDSPVADNESVLHVSELLQHRCFTSFYTV